MATDLELATRVERERGAYHATLSDEWEIWGPNGGYLAAIALRAVGQKAEIQRPRSFYCHFLSSPSFTAVQVDVEHGLIGVSGNIWDTDGRLLATGSAQLCCVPNQTVS